MWTKEEEEWAWHKKITENCEERTEQRERGEWEGEEWVTGSNHHTIEFNTHGPVFLQDWLTKISNLIIFWIHKYIEICGHP